MKTIRIIKILFFASLSFGQTQLKGQEKKGTPEILPRPDFHFKGNIGKTYLDSDPPQFPTTLKLPKEHQTSS